MDKKAQKRENRKSPSPGALRGTRRVTLARYTGRDQAAARVAGPNRWLGREYSGFGPLNRRASELLVLWALNLLFSSSFSF
jgi:hypothetical protein